MSTVESAGKPAKVEAGVKLRGAEKVARIPVKIIPTEELPRKPDWIRVRLPISPEVDRIKQLLRKHKLHSVCEEASGPLVRSSYHADQQAHGEMINRVQL